MNNVSVLKKAFTLLTVFILCCSSLTGCLSEKAICSHNEVIDVGKEPTCEEGGLSEGSHCSVCNEVIREQEIIPALGHTTDAGLCDRCGKSIGIWTTKKYVDEFGDETYRKYVTTQSNIVGTFSNSATTNSTLQVSILIDSSFVSFIFYEYGNQQVKGNNDYEYHFSIKNGNSKTKVTGRLNGDRITIYGQKNQQIIIDALSSGNTISFYVEKTKHTTDTYLFSVESSNFSIEYNSLIG